MHNALLAKQSKFSCEPFALPGADGHPPYQCAMQGSLNVWWNFRPSEPKLNTCWTNSKFNSSACVSSPICTSLGCSAKRRCGTCCWLVLSKGDISSGVRKIRFTQQVVTLVFELPFSRAQETEADEVCVISNENHVLFHVTAKEDEYWVLFNAMWHWDSFFRF